MPGLTIESLSPGMEITVPMPGKLLSENESRRLHWAKRRSTLEPWKDMGTTLSVLLRPRRHEIPSPATIQVGFGVRLNRRRDPHNYVGTVIKALVDGLVRGGTWPDDTPEFVHVPEPTITKADTDTLYVRILPRQAATL